MYEIVDPDPRESGLLGGMKKDRLRDERGKALFKNEIASDPIISGS